MGPGRCVQAVKKREQKTFSDAELARSNLCQDDNRCHLQCSTTQSTQLWEKGTARLPGICSAAGEPEAAEHSV